MFVVFSFVYLLFFILYTYVLLFALLLFFYSSIWMKAAWAAVHNVRQNMRQICESQKRTKNFRKSTWHLWSFVSHWSARQCRRQSQQIPKTGRRRRSSFIVRCSSFVVYRRLVSVVLCSLVGLVVCLAHNTIAAMSPPPSRWLRLCCSFLTSLASHLLHSLLPLWRFQCQASSC